MSYDPNRWMAAERMFASGKAYFRADGDAKFKNEVIDAFKKGARLVPYLDEDVFVASLREAAVPEAAIQEYLKTYEIENCAFFDRSWTK